jgi:hypothetical protein
MFKAQHNKNKLMLKNERTLTPSLEHEEVLPHSLLDFFSTAMFVQKIATKGANSVYNSHMKVTPSVLMYIEINVVRVLSYFIFVYSMDCAYEHSMKV